MTKKLLIKLLKQYGCSVSVLPNGLIIYSRAAGRPLRMPCGDRIGPHQMFCCAAKVGIVSVRGKPPEPHVWDSSGWLA